MTTPGQDVGALLALAAEDADELLRYQPQDDKPEIEAPDLEKFNEVNNSTDRALADGFFRHYRHLFINGDGNLYVYHKDRGAWSRDGVDNQVLAFAMHLSDRFYDELDEVRRQRAQAEQNGQGEQAARLAERATALTKLIVHCEKANTMGSVARFVKAKLVTIMADKPQKMNPGIEVLACANGVVDLRTGQLRWPQPEDYITRNTRVTYKADADSEWWEKVVLDMCNGNPRLAEFLQVWCGYVATGTTVEHCMAIFWGNGRNGKNLLIDAVAASMGGYASALPASFLEFNDKGNGGMDNNMLYAMAQLDGVRLAYVSETGEKGKLRESWVKSQTGDRTIRARLAHKDYYEFQVTHKLTVGTNHRPEVTGTDDGVWERIRLVPFAVRFGTQEELDSGIAQKLADKTLLAKASSVRGREAVLKWVVEGAGKYLAHGLRRYTPPEVTAETKHYRREQDTLGQFLQNVSEYIPPPEVARITALEGGGTNSAQFAKLTTEQRLRVEKQELWRMHCIWCEDNGHYPMSATTFARRITAAQRFWIDEIGDEKIMRPLDAVRNAGANYYRYIRLSEAGIRIRNISRARIQMKQDADRAPTRDEGDY